MQKVVFCPCMCCLCHGVGACVRKKLIHVIHYTAGPTPVQDIVIDGDTMNENWITDRKNTYNFPRLPRALGDLKFLRDCEKHRGITQLIKNEKDKACATFYYTSSCRRHIFFLVFSF